MIYKHLQLLGLPMKDRVTGFEGMVSSVCFDVYGCVQGCLSPKVTKDGKIPNAHWFDVKRLEGNGHRIMEVPPHMSTALGGEKGAADKPLPIMERPCEG